MSDRTGRERCHIVLKTPTTPPPNVYHASITTSPPTPFFVALGGGSVSGEAFPRGEVGGLHGGRDQFVE
jgi:hypothetical protein